MDVHAVVCTTLWTLGSFYFLGWAIVIFVVDRRVEREYFAPVRKMIEATEAQLRGLPRLGHLTYEELADYRKQLKEFYARIADIREFQKRAPSLGVLLSFTPCPWHWANLIWGDWRALESVYPSDEGV
jgi:hypothetical protein